VRNDPKAAFSLALQAAQRGHSRAQCLVGMCYQNGEGVNEDPAKAFAFYLFSAQQGYSLAQYNLAWCYRDGAGVLMSKVDAFYWFGMSAKQGKAGAQYSYGYCFRTGEGVQKDLSQAFHWFTKAARQGHTVAQNCLAVCFEYGEGIERDMKQAAYWYERAANGGDSQAAYNIGLCYHYGRGVTRDRAKAIVFFTRAAKAQNPDAIEAMRKLSALTTLEKKYGRGSTRLQSIGLSPIGSRNLSPLQTQRKGGSSKGGSSKGGSSKGGSSIRSPDQKNLCRPWVHALARRISASDENLNESDALLKFISEREKARDENSRLDAGRSRGSSIRSDGTSSPVRRGSTPVTMLRFAGPPPGAGSGQITDHTNHDMIENGINSMKRI